MWRILLAIVGGGLFVAMGAFVSWTGDSLAREADVVALPASDVLVRSEAVLLGAEESVSRHFGERGVVHHTVVLVEVEATNGDGEPVQERAIVHEESSGADPISVRAGDEMLHFGRSSWRRYFSPRTERTAERPAYVTATPPVRRHAYVVEESSLRADQVVFVAGLRGPEGEVRDEPLLDGVLVYPGTRAECLEALSQGATAQHVAGLVLGIVGLLVGGGLHRASRPRPAAPVS